MSSGKYTEIPYRPLGQVISRRPVGYLPSSLSQTPQRQCNKAQSATKLLNKTTNTPSRSKAAKQRGTNSKAPGTPSAVKLLNNLNNNHKPLVLPQNCTSCNNQSNSQPCQGTQEDTASVISSKVWHYTYQMLLSQAYTDVVVLSQQGTVKVHSCILAFHSEYLRRAFSEMQAKVDTLVLNLDTMPLDTVRQLVCFLYTGELQMTKFNLVPLLNVSEQYAFAKLKEKCLCFFKEVNADNAIYLLSLTTSMELQALQDQLVCFIVHSFSQVCRTMDFVYLPHHILHRILLDPQLNISSELEAFRAVVKWISYKKDSRLQYAPKLLNGPVRLELLSVEELNEEVEGVEWLFSSAEGNQVLFEAYKKKLSMTFGSSADEGKRQESYLWSSCTSQQ